MRLSIPVKSALIGLVVVAVAIPAQLVLVSRWPPPERSVPRLALVIALGWVTGVCICVLWARYVVTHRSRRLARVLDAVREGNLRSDLEPLLDADLAVVRSALIAMRAALDDLTTRLRHVDGERRRLFADLAHELATPASTILATAETLANPALCRNDDDRRRISACLDEEATRLGRLIRDVRDLARLEDPEVALEPESVDVAQLARRAAERLNLAAPDRAAIEFAQPSGPVPLIRADPIRVDQVLMNLLTNARRYSPPDGPIRVEVAPIDAGGVRVTVEDSGAGVPDELLSRLGERLLRLDPSRAAATGGSGLGLSIVLAVVYRHAGAIRFERASLGGLRVIVELPAGKP